MSQSNFFKDSQAWFSSSVSAELKKKWTHFGGRVTNSIDNADYLFSSNPASDDTKKAFRDVRGLDMILFKPKWIDYAIKVSKDAQLTPLAMERFILLPDYLNHELKKQELNTRHAHSSGEDAQNGWRDFETELIHRLETSSPVKENRCSDRKQLQSTLLVETPVQGKERKSVPNNVGKPVPNNVGSSGFNKLKVRHDYFSGPSSVSPTSSKLSSQAKNCFVLLNDCTKKLKSALADGTYVGPPEIDFQVETPKRIINKPAACSEKRSNRAMPSSVTNLENKFISSQESSHDVLLGRSQTSVDDLNHPFCALSTQSSCVAEDSPGKSVKKTNDIGRRKSTRMREGLEANNDLKKTNRKSACVSTCPSSEARTKHMNSEKRPLPNKEVIQARLDNLESDQVSGTPQTVRRKRKLYHKPEEVDLNCSVLGSMPTPSSRRRSAAEEHISPVDIHDILSSGGVKKKDSSWAFSPKTPSQAETPTSTKREIKKSCRKVMRKHKELIELKKTGQKPVEQFTCGFSSGYVHVDDLEIPDKGLEDFVVNNDGYRVELIRN